MSASDNLSLAPSVLPTYARADVTIVRGEGCRVWDDAGRSYLDLGTGIAVVSLGHLHPAPLAAAHEQLDRLWHASNLYWTEPMSRLAALLSERAGGAQAFFCNSGAESVEAAVKYARKATGRQRIVALDGGFHGRTLGALSVTGQPSKRAGFGELVPGATFTPPNEIESLERAVSPGGDVAMILLEPVLGEGGVIPLDPEFAQAAAEIAAETGAVLAVDEVQTGVGRTGSFFAYEQLGIEPQLVTLAKGLGNGLPIGALLVARRRARRPGARRSRVDVRRQPGVARGGVCRRRGGRRRPAGERRRAWRAAAVGSRSPSRRAGGPRSRAARRRGPRSAGGRGRRRLPRARGARPLRGPGRAPSRTAARLSEAEATEGLDAVSESAVPHNAYYATISHMNRRERQTAILRLVRDEAISTQGELAAALHREGFDVVQTTVSRDVHELGLVKVRAPSGRLVYAAPGAVDLDRTRLIAAAMRRYATRVEAASGGLVVVTTPAGYASALAQAIDEGEHPLIAGTLAGDNAIFVAAKEGTTAGALRDELAGHLMEGVA